MKIPLLLAFGFAALTVHAVQTDKFTADSPADFSEGEAHGISITSDGFLKLGPTLTKIVALPVSTSWATVRDSNQNTFIAGGNEGQVFKVAPDGTVTEFFKAAELQIASLALDAKGTLFAASMPDGKVYRLDEEGKSEVFFDPKEKYIWALQFDDQGNLFVGTGEKGKLYKVTPDGKGTLFYDSDETHIRSLLFHKNRLWAGSEGNGLVYRFDQLTGEQGTPFVAYDSTYKEIKALVATSDGSIFVASMGDKGGSRHLSLRPSPTLTLSVELPPPGPLDNGKPAKGEPPSPSSTGDQPGAAEITRILPDGTTERWWSDSEDAYALFLQSDRQFWVGTGHKGRLLELSGPRQVQVLGQLDADAVTDIVSEGKDSWIATTANPCTLWRIQMQSSRSGTYESRVMDSRGMSRWGALDFKGSTGTTQFSWETRSGNTQKPDKVWSDWKPLGERNHIQSPVARFAQFRLTLTTNGPEGTPALIDRVTLFYQQANQAPRLSPISLATPNFELIKTPKPEISIQPFMPQISGNPPKGGSPKLTPESSEEISSNFGRPPPIQQVRRLGWRAASWQCVDPNGDDLDYNVLSRSSGNPNWNPLESHLKDSFVSWDAATWPDGEYYLKVTASDLPSNSLESARQDEITSEAFTVDNTAPAIRFKPIEETIQRSVVAITISDTTSVVDEAEYSLDGADWRPLLPITGIYDSLSNAFVLSIKDLPPGDHYVVIRASDAADNVSSETFRFHK